MAATPYKGTIITEMPNGASGPSYRFSASDVAAAGVTFDDLPGTPSTFTVPATGLRIVDLLTSAAGVDTKALQLTKGTSQTDKILRQPAMVETNSTTPQSRCQSLYKRLLEPGAQYGFKQLA